MKDGGWLDQYQEGGEASKYIQNVPKTFGKDVAKIDETKQSPALNYRSVEDSARIKREKELTRRQTYLNPASKTSTALAMRQAAEDRIAQEKANAFTRKIAEGAQTIGGALELAAPFTGPFMPIVGGVGAGLGIGSSAYLTGKDAIAGDYGSAALNAGFGALDVAGFAALRNPAVKDFIQGADQVSDYSQVVDLTGVGSSLDDNIFKNSLGINWAKWNKEIPLNKPLMQEYKAIEQTSKANGTWMKNADGSAFTGTPEQFVQQQSSNFKKAFPEGVTRFYRGASNHIEDFANRDRADWALFGSDDINVAREYSWNIDDSHGVNSQFYKPDQKTPDWRTGSGLYELAFPNQTKFVTGNASGRDYHLLDWDPKIAKNTKSKNYATNHNNFIQDNLNTGNSLDLKGASKDTKYLSTDVYANYVKNPNNLETVAKMKNTVDGVPDLPSTIYAIDAERTPIKSLRYNNGMFDLSNPNIYKSVAPIIGAGAAASQFVDQKKNGGWLEKYNDGGPVQPNYNDYSVSAGPGFQGDGYSNVGRNYSPAWGGQFQDGGKIITSREDFSPGILSNIPGLSSLASGNQPFYNRQEQYGPLGDLYRYYGGLPLEHNVLMDSQYKPVKSKDKNAKYISLNRDPEFVNEVLENYKRVSSGKLDKGESRLGDDTWQVSGYSSAGKDAHKTTKQGSDHHSNAIGRYTLGKGKDEKGEYISYYDTFDQGTGSGISPGELLGLTKPFEIYDRIYLDPKTGKPKMADGGKLSFIKDPKLRNMLEGYQPGFLETVGDYRLPEGQIIPLRDPSSEVSISVGGGDGEPAYLIPSFKYGQPLQDPVQEFNMTEQYLGGPFKTVNDAETFRELRHQYVDKGQPLPSPIATSNMAMGGSIGGATQGIPGATGFMYARTGTTPSNGKYAKKTKASAQNGKEMKFYQEGLDFKPKSISKNGSVIKDDMGQYNHPGEITEIGSNQITMQGVPYPVLGISDTGDTQMMYPNEEYEFIGDSVTEYPMMQNGGWLDSLVDAGKSAVNYIGGLFEDPAPAPAPVVKPKVVPVKSKLDTYDTILDLGFNNPQRRKLQQQLDKGFDYSEDKNKIKLATGRFTGANVSSKLIDDLAAAAKKNNIPIGQLLTLAGRESTFGEEKGNTRHGFGSESYVSGWNVAEDYKTYDPLRFLADKKVPGVKVEKGPHGYKYAVPNEKITRDYLKKNPQILEQYKKKVAETPDIGNKNYFDLTAEFLKKKGVKGYNPGDPRYVQMFNQDYDTLKQDKQLMSYLTKKGYKYEQGGQLTKLDQLTNFTNYNTKQPGGWLDKYQ
jgi:hypothetical protein